MLNSSPSRPAGPHESWAELRAHDRITRYCRRGVGQPVLVLQASGHAPLWSALADALCDHYRLIIPELGEAEPADSRRLLEFLEGLGCSNVIVIGDTKFAAATLELVASGCDQISRVVIVGAPVEAAPMLNGGVPLLSVDAERAVPEIIARIAQFLADPR